MSAPKGGAGQVTGFEFFLDHLSIGGAIVVSVITIAILIAFLYWLRVIFG